MITAPKIDYAALAPVLILAGAAIAGVLVEAFAPARIRHRLQAPLALVSLLGALATIVIIASKRTVTAGDAYAVDGVSLFLQGAIAALGIVAMLLVSERRLEPGGPFVADAAAPSPPGPDTREGHTEVYPLALFALAGMMMFCAANDLLTMFVALEVFSLPLYLLCGLARRRRLLSQEAAVKYFLLGAFASAFFLYGLALLYGYAGSVRLADLSTPAPGRGQSLLFLGLALVAVGLLFKAAAVPFHVWTPDVYQGAPTPITALMAACTKVAAFGGLLRVLYVGFASTRADWRPVIAVIAGLTMIVGALLAVTQTDIKRLLAYSSIANAGYALTGVLAFNKDGVSGTLFYLTAYGFAVLAAFGLLTLVRDGSGEVTQLARWAGLGRRSPLLAGLFTLLLLTFAGIPLTSGFTAKFAVFSAAQGGGQTALVIVGLISSGILAFPYLRMIVLMYLSEPVEGGPTVSLPGAATSAAVSLGIVATVLLGIAPGPLLDLATKAAQFVG